MKVIFERALPTIVNRRPIGLGAVEQTLWRGLDDGKFYVSSATTVMGRPETLVFLADADGGVVSYRELGEVRELNHRAAIEAAGFEVVS